MKFASITAFLLLLLGVVHNFQPFHEHTNRTLGGRGKIACMLFKNADHVSWLEIQGSGNLS